MLDVRPAAPAAALRAPHVESDIAPLRTVLLHRPGDELRAVAADPRAALFASMPDLDRLRAEHDAFAAALRAHGVEVLLLDDLLAEAGVPRPAEPLPNLLYVRDQSCWVGPGVAVGAMATGTRAREAELVAALHRAHPRLRDAPRWDAGGVRFEGGDVLVLEDGKVAVGVSERTTREGAGALAEALLAGGAATEVLLVRVPAVAGFHLDLAVSLVDHATFAVWGPVRRALRGLAVRRTRRGDGLTSRPVPDLFRWASPDARVIEVGGEGPPAHGRLWDRGPNVLALAPGVVVAYADNEAANARLTAAGITVVPVAGAALGAGRGGPHCLSCPLVRTAA